MAADSTRNTDNISNKPSNEQIETNEGSGAEDMNDEGVKENEENRSRFKLPGDGIIMAEFDRKDAYFHAKLTEVERTRYGEQDVYLVRFVFRFVRPFSRQHRFRGANVDIVVESEMPSSDKEQNQPPLQPTQQDPQPRILKIYPEGLPIGMSEQEIQNGSDVTAGAGAALSPAQINFSVTQTHQKTVKFKGGRFVNGLIKGSHNMASWRIFEDQGSKSGISSIINAVILVQCPSGKFQVRVVAMSARMPGWPRIFGLHGLYFNSDYFAQPTAPTIIPELKIAFKGPQIWNQAIDKVLATKAVTLSDEEKVVLGLDRACESLCKVIGLASLPSGGKEMRNLVMLKRYLHDNDKSFLVMKELEESAGILYEKDVVAEKELPKSHSGEDNNMTLTLVEAYDLLQYMSPARVELHRLRMAGSLREQTRAAFARQRSLLHENTQDCL